MLLVEMLVVEEVGAHIKAVMRIIEGDAYVQLEAFPHLCSSNRSASSQETAQIWQRRWWLHPRPRCRCADADAAPCNCRRERSSRQPQGH